MNDLVRILIAEDRPVDAELEVREIRKSLGDCTFQRVETERDYLDALKTFHPDLILSDYNMPNFTGMAALKLALEHAPLTPVIIITGSINEDTAVQCMKAGAANYVIKENIKRLGTAVIHALEESRAHIEAARAESERRQIQERHHNLLQGLIEGCQILDYDWRYVYVNPAAARQGRLTPESLLTQKMTDIYPGIEGTEMFHTLQLSMEDRTPRRTESQFFFGDGTSGWFDLSIEPVPEGLFILSMEITDRKQAEQNLRRSEERFRRYFELGLIGMAITAPGKGFVEVNDQLCAILGYERDELLNIGWADLTHPDDLAADVAQFERVLAGKIDAYTLEKRWLRKDRRIIDSSISVRCLRQPDGSVDYFVALVEDTTERKKAEATLRDRQARYQELFEDSPISLWEEDFSALKQRLLALRQEGITKFDEYFDAYPESVRDCVALIKVLDVNKATLAMQGATRKEDLLGSLQPVLEGEALEGFKHELVAIESGKTSSHWEGANKTLDDRVINVELNWSAVPGYETSLSQVIVSVIDVTERKQAQAKVERQVRRLSALRAIDTAISSSFDLRVSLNILLSQAITELQVDAAVILLVRPEMVELEYSAGIGFRTTRINSLRWKLGENAAGKAALERRTIHISNLVGDELHGPNARLIAAEQFIDSIAIPLVAKGQVKGVMQLFQRSALDPEPEWLEFLETLGDQAAIAIDNGQLFSELQSSNLELGLAYDSTIEGWSRAMDLRDKETEGHTQRVTEWAVKLATCMGFPVEELRHIRRGALLHDIGKMGVPDTVLLKPGPLSEEEWVAMKRHPVLAYEMLSPIRYLQAAINIPYCHHEKWDGTGYPRGLKGEQIPLAARMFAIIDVYDALTSDRPYRAAWTRERALEHIKAESGKHFDSQVAQQFLDMMLAESDERSRVEAG